jgi:hypothetical protein
MMVVEDDPMNTPQSKPLRALQDELGLADTVIEDRGPGDRPDKNTRQALIGCTNRINQSRGANWSSPVVRAAARHVAPHSPGRRVPFRVNDNHHGGMGGGISGGSRGMCSLAHVSDALDVKHVVAQFGLTLTSTSLG